MITLTIVIFSPISREFVRARPPKAAMDGQDVYGLARRNFHHPYTPYEIQETFMRTVFEVLECGEGGVGILESPTGTVSIMLKVDAAR